MRIEIGNLQFLSGMSRRERKKCVCAWVCYTHSASAHIIFMTKRQSPHHIFNYIIAHESNGDVRHPEKKKSGSSDVDVDDDDRR